MSYKDHLTKITNDMPPPPKFEIRPGMIIKDDTGKEWIVKAITLIPYYPDQITWEELKGGLVVEGRKGWEKWTKSN